MFPNMVLQFLKTWKMQNYKQQTHEYILREFIQH
jgi:hypothetical protein